MIKADKTTHINRGGEHTPPKGRRIHTHTHTHGEYPSVQFIQGANKTNFAVIDKTTWDKIEWVVNIKPKHMERIKQHFQDLQDIEDAQNAWDQYIENPKQHIPTEIFYKVLDGGNPVRIYRKWRGLSVKQLADKTDIGVQTLYKIENGTRIGDVFQYQRIAEALNLILDDIIPVEQN